MKYTFEVTTHETENIIKVEVAYGSPTYSASRTIKYPDEDTIDLPTLIEDLIDNIRLTVKERKDATYNAHIFNNYINYSNNNKQKQVMIVENGDPAVIGGLDDKF